MEMCRNPKMNMIFLFLIQEIGFTHMRVAEGVNSLLQMAGLLGRLCKKMKNLDMQESYAVISMVCTTGFCRLVQMAPSSTVLVVLWLRTPSAEPTLEAEWVLERTRRVIPAVGTGGRHIDK
ncbi:hypothetical protein XENOCAPTIV_003476 [Xenoophorus captivus]|uniref:Replication factor C C-terminal domain-containing protein n=1 Tax=Xenoophorus captivus TaxID=1517983 RepID=A0ABV0Q7U2_9TELE